MQYTVFNQSGRALMMSDSITDLDNAARMGGYRFYFITNDKNEVVMNEMKGRALPKRTSRGTVKESK